MAKYLWALCCENAVVDSTSNNLSLINIVEQFNVPTVPVMIPQKYFVASLWQRETPISEEERFNLKFVIQPEEMDPVNADVPIIEAKIPQGKARLRHLCAIQGFPISKEGNLAIKIMLSQTGEAGITWTEANRITIEVKIKTL